ncbi:hypothetical protein Bbelb_276610 [Branchiostoma belcheri]|nr:hypothetical protein Bbelb_276610 [Branchiostoma belcheri]
MVWRDVHVDLKQFLPSADTRTQYTVALTDAGGPPVLTKYRQAFPSAPWDVPVMQRPDRFWSSRLAPDRPFSDPPCPSPRGSTLCAKGLLLSLASTNVNACHYKHFCYKCYNSHKAYQCDQKSSPSATNAYPFKIPPFLSPLYAVPKKKPRNFRLIHALVQSNSPDTPVSVSRPNADVVPPEALKLALERTHYLTITAL